MELRMKRFWISSAAWLVLVIGATPAVIEALDRKGVALAIPGLPVTASEILFAVALALLPLVITFAWMRRQRRQP